jgi:hypothetical protein
LWTFRFLQRILLRRATGGTKGWESEGRKGPEIPHNVSGFIAKFDISKLFRAQPFDIPQNRQGNVFENLEAAKITE